jgi:1-acyl-sn-glycerol-3-phosphate acyltransferase
MTKIEQLGVEPPVVDFEKVERAKSAIQTVLGLGAGLTVGGQENIPSEAPYVLVGSHGSNYDPFAIGACIPSDHTLYFPAKDSLAKIPYDMEACGAMFFKRGIDAEATRIFNMSLRVLRMGGVVCIFPEATRWHGQDLKPFEEFAAGGAAMAVRTNVLIIPVSVGGVDNVLRGKLNPKPKKIHVEFGEPIDPSEFKGAGRINQVNRYLYDSLGKLKSRANAEAGADYTRAKRRIDNDKK